MADGTTLWQLDRRVSLGHLVTTATFLMAMVVWGGRLDTRIALLEETRAGQAAVDARQDLEARRVREEIRDELVRLNEKLDRIYESRARPGASLPSARWADAAWANAGRDPGRVPALRPARPGVSEPSARWAP